MKLKANLLTFTASVLLALVGQAVAQTPKDQIALQLGAIQMGYKVPFAVSANSTATQKQQAVNSLVMGRNAMNATVALPAANVKGVVKSPKVNSADYRDQLYSAVEYVVTSPVSASINGSVVMSNNATVTVNATALKAASVSNDWMNPVPYALESRSSVDTQALRAELVAAGVLKYVKVPSAPTFVFYAPAGITGITGGAKGDYVVVNSSQTWIGFRFNGISESFGTFVSRRLTTNTRILKYDYDLLLEAISTPSNLRTIIPGQTTKQDGETITGCTVYIAIPSSQGNLIQVTGNFNTSASNLPTLTKDNLGAPLVYNGVTYTVYRMFSDVPFTSTWPIQLVNFK